MATPLPVTTNLARERKLKSEQDFTRNRPIQPGPSTGKGSAKSATTSAKSATTSAKGGQLTLSAKKKTESVSASHTRGHEQLNKKISRARLGSRVLPNLLTPGGVELGEMTRIAKAWNDVDCPNGPSLTWNILQGLEGSVAELKDQLEVISTSCLLSTHVHYHT